jgi:hypothetical protein
MVSSHDGRGVVTFDTGEVINVRYSLRVHVSSGLIEATGNVEANDPLGLMWFGKNAVITLQDGTRLPIFFDRTPAHFTATSGPLS